MKGKFIFSALLSGILLSLAWLGFSGLILLFSLIPLLWLDDYFCKNKTYYVSLVFWLYSLLTFLCWNALTTWWIWHATPAGAVFAILTNSFLMSLVWLLVHLARRMKGNGFANLFLIFSWLSFEYLHFNWDLSWPWLTLGNGLANDIIFIQWFEYTGVLGGSTWIILANLVGWGILKKLFNKEIIQSYQWFLLSGLVVLPILFSLYRYNIFVEKEAPVTLAIIQPNIDPYNEKFSGMPYEEQYRSMLSIADSIGTNDVDFFIGPETALHDVWLNQIEKNPTILQFRNFIDEEYPNSAFVIGAMAFQKYLSSKLATQTARYAMDSTLIYDAFNAAFLINNSENVQTYFKSKLVSGVEKMPFKRALSFLDPLIINIGGTTGTLGTMHETVLFENKGIKIGVPICYESVFGEYSSEFVQKGAELLFVITNDGWWKNTPGYQQHLSYSKILAIQYRRGIARAANTGISAFINQKGEIVQSTEWWSKTGMVNKLNRNSHITFYAEQGDYLGRISLFMFQLMMLLLGVEHLKNKKNRITLIV